jgi:hypothetical protein
MEFKLNDKELKKLKKWQNAIKKKFGECGNFVYSFTPTGIGDSISVYSKLLDESIDITDYGSW